MQNINNHDSKLHKLINEYNSLIDDLLESVRLEQGQSALSMVSTDLAPLIGAVLERLPAGQPRLHVECPEPVSMVRSSGLTLVARNRITCGGTAQLIGPGSVGDPRSVSH